MAPMPICDERGVAVRRGLVCAGSVLLLACSDDQPVPPGQSLTPVWAVQGDGDVSPFDGKQVIISGIVTGDFQDNDANQQANLGGFFVQDEVPDGDPATSDGIFVYDGPGQTTDVLVGYRVRVEGTVTEFFGETQLKASTVKRTGIGTVTPAALEFSTEPLANADDRMIADFERFEGMLVKVPENLYVSDLSALERYGEILLSRRQRLRQFTNGRAPDVEGWQTHQQEVAVSSLLLDDGIAAQNPLPERFLAAGKRPVVRAGDLATNLIGNIRFSRGSGGSGLQAYRLEPTVAAKFMDTNPRSDAPPELGGSLTVATFNVLNYFTSLDSGAAVCGPARAADCRGADSDAEFTRQRAKIANAIRRLNADIVGIMEIENNGGAAIADLVDAINDGEGDWAHIDTGVIGSDTIAVGLIYRTTASTPVGDFSILDTAVDKRFDDTKNRPALAQTFRLADDNATFTVVINHLKSKGSDCNDSDDPDRRDGQGNCNQTRTRAVHAMIDWLAHDPTGSGDPDVLIVGDLNAYLMEDPVRTLEAAGFVNLLHGDDPAGEHYSFVFDGQAGALDHAFASPALLPQVSGAAAWHINADEAPFIDYNLEFGRSPALFEAALPYRASDHDPVLIGINPL